MCLQLAIILQFHCTGYVINALIFYILSVRINLNLCYKFLVFFKLVIYVLLQNLVADIDNNVITSPLSLYMILSLLSNGSGGSTLNELKSILYYNNAIFSNHEFEELIHLLKVK